VPEVSFPLNASEICGERLSGSGGVIKNKNDKYLILQSKFLKRDNKFTAKQFRFEQTSSLPLVICIEIGLNRQNCASRLDPNPAWKDSD
jgi:hypothetical protein